MPHRLRLLATSIATIISGHFCLAADFPCPIPTKQIATEIKADVDGKAKTIFEVGTAAVKGQVETTVVDLYSKYPAADRVAIIRDLIYTTCQFIKNSPTLSDDEKLTKWFAFLPVANTFLPGGKKEDVEGQKDEQTRQMISQINPGTPKERLVQIFGSPIFSGKSDWSDGMSLDIYQYKYAAWAFDYRLGVRRLGLILATKDPWEGSSMLFDQIRGEDIAEAYQDCGGILATAHFNARSKLCVASHATNYIESVYFFMGVFTTQIKKESKSNKCQSAGNQDYLPDPGKCPGFSSVPALAIAMVSNPSYTKSIDVELIRVSNAFLAELDFGGTVVWRSPAEAELSEKRIDAENKMNEAQLDVAAETYRQDRAQKYRALVDQGK